MLLLLPGYLGDQLGLQQEDPDLLADLLADLQAGLHY